MNPTVIDIHNGVRFQVEAVPRDGMFLGRFTILDDVLARSGTDDTFRPTIENAWATEAEALTYATEAAHHVIEGIPPFIDHERGDGPTEETSHGRQPDR
ncbi:MAG TPA: hypothetical protein VIN58_08810 [Roseateles sp.]